MSAERTPIQKAGAMARGDRLTKLYEICERQATISTRKLLPLVDELAASDRALATALLRFQRYELLAAEMNTLWTALRVARTHITDAAVLAAIDHALEPLEERHGRDRF